MVKKTLKVLMAVSVAAFFASCSSDSHSPSKPNDQTSELSSASDDDDLFDDEDEDISSSSSKRGGSSSSKGSAFDDEDGDDSDGDDADGDDTGDDSGDVGVATSCVTKTSAGLQDSLDTAYPKIFDIFGAVADGDTDAAKSNSKSAKNAFSKILKNHPDHCAAQFGYAVASFYNVYNNGNIGNYLQSFNDAANLYESVDGLKRVSQILNKVAAGTDETLTKDIQNVLGSEILPVVDSAIAFVKNVVNEKTYALQFEMDGETRELDNSEFGIVLGAMYGVKAAATALASVNLEFDKSGSYSWIADMDGVRPTDTETHNSKATAAIKKMVSLFGKNSLFTSVNSGWEKKWKNVPNMLDSALIYVKSGLKFSLSDDSQENDIYVVGNGADADISVADVNDAISSISDMQEGLKNGEYVVEVGESEVTVNIRKIFANTKGFTQYLPYYVFEDESDFDTFYFTDEDGNETASLREFQGPGFDGFTLTNAVDVIVFPDPSFGGVFPDFQSQRDIWKFLISVQD